MKICQLSYSEDSDSFHGYMEQDGEFFEFEARPNGEMNQRKMEFKGGFRDYIHFAGVMGKFNPWARFLRDPIPIIGLTHAALHIVRSESPFIE